LYGCWLAAEYFADTSLPLTAASLCSFLLLFTAIRYFASLRLKQILSTSPLLSANEAAQPPPEKQVMTDVWLPERKLRFVLLLCLAAVLIYLVGEVTSDWSPTLLGFLSMLVLYFAQAKPDFQPFPSWALMILPLAALVSSALGLPLYGRAPITSISFGVALFCSAFILRRTTLASTVLDPTARKPDRDIS